MRFFNIVTLEKNKNDKDYKKGGKQSKNFENSLIMHQFCIKHNEKNQNE